MKTSVFFALVAFFSTAARAEIPRGFCESLLSENAFTQFLNTDSVFQSTPKLVPGKNPLTGVVTVEHKLSDMSLPVEKVMNATCTDAEHSDSFGGPDLFLGTVRTKCLTTCQNTFAVAYGQTTFETCARACADYTAGLKQKVKLLATKTNRPEMAMASAVGSSVLTQVNQLTKLIDASAPAANETAKDQSLNRAPAVKKVVMPIFAAKPSEGAKPQVCDLPSLASLKPISEINERSSGLNCVLALAANTVIIRRKIVDTEKIERKPGDTEGPFPENPNCGVIYNKPVVEAGLLELGATITTSAAARETRGYEHIVSYHVTSTEYDAIKKRTIMSIVQDVVGIKEEGHNEGSIKIYCNDEDGKPATIATFNQGEKNPLKMSPTAWRPDDSDALRFGCRQPASNQTQ